MMPASISSSVLAISSSTIVIPRRSDRLVLRHIGENPGDLDDTPSGLAGLLSIDAHADDFVIAGLTEGERRSEIGRIGVVNLHPLGPSLQARRRQPQRGRTARAGAVVGSD